MHEIIKLTAVLRINTTILLPVILLGFFGFCLPSKVAAQEKARNNQSGVSLSLGSGMATQGGTYQHVELAVPFSVGSRVTLAPAFAHMGALGGKSGDVPCPTECVVGDGTGLQDNFAVGFLARHYLRTHGVTPFVGGRLMALTDGTGADGLFTGVSVGGAYTIKDQLSLNIEMQLNRRSEGFQTNSMWLATPLFSIVYHF